MARTELMVAVFALLSAAPLVAQQREVSLPDALRLAELVQPAVIQARANVMTADARLRTTRAAYLPNLSISSSGSKSATDGAARIDPITGEVLPGGSSTTSLSSGVNASVDLFTGFRRGADIGAARATTEAASASLSNARFQQRLNTTNAFFDALAARQLLAVREASVRRAQEQLKISVSKLAAGSATRSDSLRSRVTLGTAQLQLLNAQTTLATSEANLARNIGVTGRVRAAEDSALYHLSADVDSAALRAEAYEKSPSVQAALASSRAAAASLRASRSGYWPTLALSAGTSFNGSNRTDYHLFNQRQVSLQLSWTLFNRFSREQQIATQQANLDIAAANAADIGRGIETTLTGQLASLQAARAGIDIAQTSVAAATEDLRVVQERYRLGAATIVDVLTSQESLNQAEIDAVNARFGYLRARAQIEALLGRSL
ncbi:MAG: TolC family protein [Gemmatimonadales bacterium]|nr:TolC family protein [Gemmatimonadales bacterium]